MRPEESLYPADWLRVADKDLGRVDVLLAAHDAEGAAFHLQQAVEKLLKSFLLSRGWELRRIHDLEVLLNEALPHDGGLERFRPLCLKAKAFYLPERYPFVGDAGLTEDDVREPPAQARELADRLRALVPGAGRVADGEGPR